MIRRAQHAEDVDPPVALEVLILNRNHRLAQHRRKSFIGNNHPPLQGKGAEDAPVHVEEVGGGDRTVSFEVRDLRQVYRVHQHQAGQ